MTTKKILAVSLALVGVACLGCAPSIDPAAKADVDRRLATLAPSGQDYAPPTVFMPRPLAVGQWTQHKMIDDKGQPALLTYKIVGESGGAFWVESVHESYFGKTATKSLLFIGDRMNPQSIDIRAMKTRDKNGRVSEIPPGTISLVQSMFRGSVSMLAVSWQGQAQEDAAVAAGRFAGCFKLRSDASWGPWHSASMSWSHAAVPISGMVKSQGIDKPMTMELVGFGDGGAVSEFP